MRAIFARARMQRTVHDRHHPHPSRTEHVPRILITTEAREEPDVLVMLDERIATSDLTSDHFAGQLVQRIAWALADAETTERKPGDHRERLLVRPRERGGVVAGVAC
jgi:hypothetical protein